MLTGENQGYAMCQEIEGIDLLLTGHQHRDISHTMANGVTILQTGCNGHSVGKVKVTFEKMKHKWVKKRVLLNYYLYKGLQHQDVLSLVADYEEKHKSGLINLLELLRGHANFRCYANSFA